MKGNNLRNLTSIYDKISNPTLKRPDPASLPSTKDSTGKKCKGLDCITQNASRLAANASPAGPIDPKKTVQSAKKCGCGGRKK